MLQRALFPLFLLVINVFSGVRAQTFTIVSDRIEYIDPGTHKLITITENLGDFKSIKLSRVDNYFAIHFPKNDTITSEKLNYFFKLYTSKVPDEWLAFEEELRLVGLEDGDYTLLIMARSDAGQQSQNTLEIHMGVPHHIGGLGGLPLCMIVLVLELYYCGGHTNTASLKLRKTAIYRSQI